MRELLRHESLVEMTAASFNRLALAAMEATEYATAIMHFNQAIQLRPDMGQYYFHRALLLQATGHLEAAKADHLIAVRLDPECMSLDFERLSLGMQLKQLPKSDEDVV
ncbi:hypothetical protein IQ266_12045 [filamentous cyanobacterium LEGE 11480]|uniref:Tetratricopeptide repeat protein n=1 Tax=Romeriopsis navalis LEGE 11480 TaxID=2777977 RepID=A0A928VMR0_9CYAN|nr:hypothetical protein [Romeriopsis navalis]MBE9030462.1 hypothetical protein [Romeriopsis navalis LEGE 11480]